MKIFQDKQSEKKYYEQEASEIEFLEWYKAQDHARYEKPSVTVDTLIFGWKNDTLNLLFVKRGCHPYLNHYAFPGGFLTPSESPDQAAVREACEETGITLRLEDMEQFQTVGTPGRDPRAWVITIAYLVYLPTMDQIKVKGGSDAKSALWLQLKTNGDGVPILEKNGETIPLSALAFDHPDILENAVSQIRAGKFPGIYKILGKNPAASDVEKLNARLKLPKGPSR